MSGWQEQREQERKNRKVTLEVLRLLQKAHTIDEVLHAVRHGAAYARHQLEKIDKADQP